MGSLRAVGTCAVGMLLFALFAGCGSSSSGGGGPNNPAASADGGAGGGSCSPGAKECVSPTLARVCPADGASWLSVACGAGQVCSNGDCTTNLSSPCAPGTGSCSSATAGVQCRADGQGYNPVTCPAGTSCTGNGVCAGACIVGESYCLAPGVLATCADGKTLTQTACGGTDLCVATSSTPVRTAACKPTECRPAPGGCDFTCGDRLNPTADQTKAMSFCQATPDGYKWSVVACANNQSCNPTGGVCGNGQDKMAACQSACTPGDQRCAANGAGYQTCDATGAWSSTITSCTPNASSQLQVCMPKPGSPGSVVCGDRLCAQGYAGTCDATGQLAACVNGKVSATAAACATGICRDVGNPIDGMQPGACVTDCKAGETKCTAPNATSYQSCSGGVWSGTTTTCASGACYGYTDATGLRLTVCGVCAPGTHRCLADQIETCDATGQWGAATACAIGLCRQINNGSDAACVQQCVPGSTVCMGADKAVPGLPYASGTAAQGTCTANGLLPASPTACTGTQACRVSSTGVAVGCVECVGTNVKGGNELGFVDSRCTDTNGNVPGNAATEVCTATNTWPGAATACGNATTCSISAPGYSCQGACQDPYDYGGKCTASGLATAFPGSNVSCSSIGQTAVQCGTTPDCCSGHCQPTGNPVPVPAYCK
jgi:hypothetical protein